MDGAIRKNYEKIEFTSVCDVHDVDIQCEDLVQNSADIYDSIIRTTSLTSVATLVTPTFGTTTDLRDSEFIQEGAGHAIELATVGGTYNMQSLVFTGYGADASDSAALDITAASGTTTLNLSSMATPTYKTAGATVVVNNPVTVTLTGLVTGTEIRVYDSGDDSVIDGIESSGTSWAFSDAASNVVYMRIFHVNYLPADIEDYTIPASATSIPIQQIFDRNFDNP
jgi:hypothetical protein